MPATSVRGAFCPRAAQAVSKSAEVNDVIKMQAKRKIAEVNVAIDLNDINASDYSGKTLRAQASGLFTNRMMLFVPMGRWILAGAKNI